MEPTTINQTTLTHQIVNELNTSLNNYEYVKFMDFLNKMIKENAAKVKELTAKYDQIKISANENNLPTETFNRSVENTRLILKAQNAALEIMRQNFDAHVNKVKDTWR